MTHFADFDARKARPADFDVRMSDGVVGWARAHEHDVDPFVRQAARKILRRHYVGSRECERRSA